MFNGYIELSIDKMDVRLEGTHDAVRPDASAPKAPIVTVVGCVSRSANGVPMLTNASAAKASAIVHADAKEIAEARNTPLGTNRYRLVGTADFSSVGELMSQGQRALFTREATANVTDALQNGYKVALKGLMIPGSTEVRLNVLSARPLADRCK
jgi:hypothetical protein